MKRICTIVAATLLSFLLIGQTPSSFKYQAVLRDASGNVKANTNVNIDIAIVQGNASGSQVLLKAITLQLTTLVLVNLEIGSKNSSSFAGIDGLGALLY